MRNVEGIIPANTIIDAINEIDMSVDSLRDCADHGHELPTVEWIALALVTDDMDMMDNPTVQKLSLLLAVALMKLVQR